MEFYVCFVFFFQAEDGIRDGTVTGVQTCALPISAALVTGFLRNAVGGGIGLALMPVLTSFLAPQPTLALIGLLLLLSDPISLWLYGRRWNAAEARRLVPAMLVGIGLGGWLVAASPPRRCGRGWGEPRCSSGSCSSRSFCGGAPRPRRRPLR